MKETQTQPEDWLQIFAKRESREDILQKVVEHQATEDWLYGTVQSVFEDVTFRLGTRFVTQHMLEILTDDGITCYVRQGQAGFMQPNDSAFVTMIGERVPIKIYQRIPIQGSKKTDIAHEDYGEFVIIGEINGAEYTIGEAFAKEFSNKNSNVHKELRGVVKSVFVPKRAKRAFYGSSNYVDYRRVVVDYNGLTVVIPATEFTYKAQSRVQKLENLVKRGDIVYFKVTDVTRVPVTSEMRYRNPDMSPDKEYYYYAVVGTAKYRELSPEMAIKRLLASGAKATQAYIANYDVNSGYFVELKDAPGIIFKMVPSGKGKIRPSEMDCKNHALVPVKIKFVDEKDSKGFYKGKVEYIRTA